MKEGHHHRHPLLPPPLRSAYTTDIRWPHVMYVFVVFRIPLSTGLTLFEQSGYIQDLPISPVSATFSENGDNVGSYLSSDCITHLQETTYPHIPSLPIEDTFNHRWGGYVPPAAETLL
jgi:hypothetical protein